MEAGRPRTNGIAGQKRTIGRSRTFEEGCNGRGTRDGSDGGCPRCLCLRVKKQDFENLRTRSVGQGQLAPMPGGNRLKIGIGWAVLRSHVFMIDKGMGKRIEG